MSPDWVPAFFFLLAIAAALLGLTTRATRWLAGRPGPSDGIRGLLYMPRRYLVNVHEVVYRDPVGGAGRGDTGRQSAILHILTAGGLIAATVLILLLNVLGLGGRIAAVLLLAALASMAAGLVLEVLRRLPHRRPPRLSGGGFNHLPWALAAFIVFFTFVTLPELGVMEAITWSHWSGVLLMLAGLFGTLEMYAGMGFGPMKHAPVGALHLAFHPRPKRFENPAAETGLRPLDLNAEQLGANHIHDFQWNQLLGFDACVECGRCEVACPAFEAGQPLNPKKLIQDLVIAQSKSLNERSYTGRAHPGRPVGDRQSAPDQPLIGREANAAIDPDTLWACTTCQACVYECPMMIEHVDAVVEMRRYQTLEKGATPGKGALVLEELRGSDNLSGRPHERRMDWAADLNLPRLKDRERCEVLLWLGEGAYDMRNQQTLRALVRLLQLAEVNFATLGEEELDCGHVARVLGDEALFQDLRRRNLEILAQYSFERIITADPHALHTLRNEYPDIGNGCPVEHHTAFLAALIEQGRLRPDAAGGQASAPVTFHDPCYLARANRETQAPRKILASMGLELREMAKSGERTSCCGWGGGASFTDIPGKRRIPDVRMEHAQATEAAIVGVACPNCAIMLEGVVGPRPEVKDVAEMLLDNLEKSS